MAEFYSLPLYIHKLILSFVLERAESLREWHQHLAILSVCLVWRRLALPAVFSQLHIDFSPGTFTLKQQLLLVRCVASFHRHLVKHIAIALTQQLSLSTFASNIAAILQLGKVHWLNAQSLLIYAAKDTIKAYDNVYDDGHSIDKVLTAFPVDLYKSMPQIAQLKMHLVEENRYTLALTSSIVNRYAARLTWLECTVPIALTIRHFSAQLSRLVLDARSAGMQHLPSVCAKSLRILELYEVPECFSWNSFRCETTPGRIVFGRLRELVLSFDFSVGSKKLEPMALSSYSLQLHFPQLQRLVIVDCPLNCHALFADSHYTCLRSVHISGWLSAADMFAQAAASPIDELRIQISRVGAIDSSRFYSATNRLFGTADMQGSHVAELSLSALELDLDPQMVEWWQLSRLNIVDSSVPFGTVLALANKLLNLQSLCVYTCTVADDGLNQLEQHNSHPKLTTVSIGFAPHTSQNCSKQAQNILRASIGSLCNLHVS
ncbi:hypothetical protein LPJ55_001886 [Coemansia sp. RSA 990]|nr:hypothetical protein LPJ55_001886 [Coemansia sp. RSA 990]